MKPRSPARVTFAREVDTMSKRLNYQALSMLALTNGIDQCREALKADGVANPDKIAQKAATQLAVMGAPQETIAMLNGLAREFTPENSGVGRGRVALSAGESREYKVQQIEGADLFIRLPVGVLGGGISKGDTVTVEVSPCGQFVTVRA